MDLWGKNAKSSFAPWFMPLVSEYCCSAVCTLHIVFPSSCSMISGEMNLGRAWLPWGFHAGRNSPSTLKVRNSMMPSVILPLCPVWADSQWLIDRGKGQIVTSASCQSWHGYQQVEEEQFPRRELQTPPCTGISDACACPALGNGNTTMHKPA